MNLRTKLLVSLAMTAMGSLVQAQPLVYNEENTGASCAAPPLPAMAQLPTYAMLPDPFAWSNGSGRIKTFEDWKCRRNEIKREIENYEIGVKPPKPSNITASYAGTGTSGTLTVKVTENGKTLTLTSAITLPSGTGPFPAIIGMNSGTGGLPANTFSSRNIARITYNHDQVTKYNSKSSSDPFFQLYPTLTANGQYSAWAWGVSRLIDGLELVKAQLPIDTRRLAVSGCSYAGKMALFAGAFDERIALTIPQESGGGGCASWRFSETMGEVEKLGATNSQWFMQSMFNFKGSNVTKLPHDHHELIAMIAPRACLVIANGATNYVWLAEESGYVSCRAAEEVWKVLGIPDRFGFSHSGHTHCGFPSDQNTEINAFVDKFLLGKTANTSGVAKNPFPNTDYNKWITAWKGLKLVIADPNVPAINITAPIDGSTVEASATINVRASVTDADNNVTLVEFFDGSNKIGEDASSPYAFTWANASVGNHTLTAVVTDAAGHKTTSGAIVVKVSQTYGIYQAVTPIVVDGTAEEQWNNANTVSGKTLSGTIANAADLSATFKTMWDNNFLYVLANVTDQTLNNDSQNWYDDDGIEVYVDINNDKANTYGANDVQYSFGWDNGTTVGSLPTGRITTGITYASVVKTGGYIIEARIPWSTMQASPVSNQMIGIEFMVNDDDNGTARDKKLAWTSNADEAWENPSLFGVAKLVSGVVLEVEEQLSVDGIRCYPNPFTSEFSIVAKGQFSYQLMTQMGQVLEVGQGIGQVSCAKEYPKGVYLLRVTQEQGSHLLKVVKE